MKDYLNLEKKETGASPFHVLWTAKNRSAMLSPGCSLQSKFFISDLVGNIVATDLSTGKKIWSIKIDKCIVKEPLYIANNLVWVSDSKGVFYGFSPLDGTLTQQWYVPFGISHVSLHKNELLFLRQAKRSQPMMKIPCRINLQTGETVPLVDGDIVVGEILDFGYCADDSSFLLVRKHSVEKYSLIEGARVMVWDLSALKSREFEFNQSLGFTVFRNGWAFVRSTYAHHIGDQLKVINPEPLVVAIGKNVQTYGHELWSPSYFANAVDIDGNTSLLAMGSLVLKINSEKVLAFGTMPESRLWHGRGAGVFRMGTRYVVFRSFERRPIDKWPEEGLGYYLQPYFLDSAIMSFEPAGPALKISPEGKNFQSPRVDQIDNSFLFRGDARFHLVSFTN